MDNMIFKILGSVKDRSFLRKVNEHSFNLHSVKSQSALLSVGQSAEYQKLYDKYRSVLERDIPVSYPRSPSDRVWTCWLQGEENAPPLIKACIASMRRYLPDKEITVITDDNADSYIKIPGFIKEKRKKGIIPPAHYSDFIRCALLCKYGGLWMDSTVLVTSPELPRFIFTQPLFVFKKVDLSRSPDAPVFASNWLIGACSHDPVLETTLRLLLSYWKNEERLTHYYVFHLFFAMAARKYPDNWAKVPTFNNCSPHTLMFELEQPFSQQRWEQLLRISDIHKLNRHLQPDESLDSFYRHILRQYGQENNVREDQQ